MDPQIDLVLHKEVCNYAESNYMLHWEVSAKTRYSVERAFILILDGWLYTWQRIRRGIFFHKSDYCTDLVCQYHRDNPEWSPSWIQESNNDDTDGYS